MLITALTLQPQNVKAHLSGGIPTEEIDVLEVTWDDYPGLKESLFLSRSNPEFHDLLMSLKRGPRSSRIENFPAVLNKHADFQAALDGWKQNLAGFEALGDKKLGDKGVFALRRDSLKTIEQHLMPMKLLNQYKVRGALADWFKTLEADFKSVAASGWNAELIPDEVLFASQCADVVKELETKQARINELQAFVDAADEEDFEPSDENPALPSAYVKQLKENLKDHKATSKNSLAVLKAQIKDAFIQLKSSAELPKGTKQADFSAGLTENELNFAVHNEILGLAKQLGVQLDNVELIKEHARKGALAAARPQPQL